MANPIVRVRLWDRRGKEFAGKPGFGQGLFIDAYETLEPPLHRQTLYITGNMRVRKTDTTIEFGYYNDVWTDYIRVNYTNCTATVCHKVQPIPVVYEEALQVIEELRALGFH